MSLITITKIVTNETLGYDTKNVVLSGVAKNGIVLDDVKLTKELELACNYFLYQQYSTKYNKMINNENISTIDKTAYKTVLDDYFSNVKMERSKYTFVNRVAVCIINDKTHHIQGEVKLYDALRFAEKNDVGLVDFSATRKIITPILNEILEIKECPYLKPIQVKLNLTETASIYSTANTLRARWTAKGIQTKANKYIQTETAIQAILFVLKNCLSFTIPTKVEKDTRDTI